MNNESQATLLILKVKSSETEKLSYALWELPGVRGIEEGPLDGDTLFRPEAEFEILEFGSEAAQKCAEWMERESYRPKGQMLLKIYLDPAQLTLAGGETQWLKKLPSRYSYEIVSVEVLQEKDYLKAYKESVQGTHLEHGLFVGPPWSKLENTSGDYFFVEPGLAFGTGDHPTTQLCLERIKEFSLENKWKQNFRALDLGAGSGVLGVALKRYFPQCDLLLADYDPLCGAEIEKTFKLNNELLVGSQIVAGPAGTAESLLAQGVGRFDFIVSNIYAEVLAKNVSFIRQLLCPGGVWLLSGILEGVPEQTLLEALCVHNFEIKLRRSRDRNGATWKDSGLESSIETWVLLEVM